MTCTLYRHSLDSLPLTGDLTPEGALLCVCVVCVCVCYTKSDPPKKGHLSIRKLVLPHTNTLVCCSNSDYKTLPMCPKISLFSCGDL